MHNPFAFGTGPWDPSHRFETSWVLPPFVLFVLRVIMSLYIFVTLLFNIGYECAHAEQYGCEDARDNFSYFTVLTYWGLAFYLLFSALHTFTYARSTVPLLDSWPRPLQALHSFYFTTVTTFPFIVTVVYWGLLYQYGSEWFPTAYDAWLNISQHAFNSLFALSEILLSRIGSPPWIHGFWLLILMSLYLALAEVTHATKGFYTYGFLDPSIVHSVLAAYICGIGIGTVIVFGIVKYVVLLRVWITETKMGQHGKFAGPRPQEVELEDLEAQQDGSDVTENK
ncbi:hypothetical protein F4818DRAFT_134427 [Hypoxylon cercidicola]|nr:hypothetical protein F4818DRAFT_134427 [Hypoxylon cercidicola]